MGFNPGMTMGGVFGVSAIRKRN